MKKLYKTGLIVGKFYPLHRGHQYLIETGLESCRHLHIVVCELSDEEIPGATRASWIQELYPKARVEVRNCDGVDPEPHDLWARLAIEWLGGKPDVVLTSENYGEPWAKAIGCAHILVDLKREKYPVSGTKVRSDPHDCWSFLSEPVRAHFAKRVVLVGAESTGKTTLARGLARELKTIWVPEYGRLYAEGKLYDGLYGQWTDDEFEHIAVMQNKLEDQLARKANKILICDTDSFATSVWHKRYQGHNNQKVDQLSHDRKVDLYLVTAPDFPFVQDGTRDGEKIRDWMHQEFLRRLKREGIKYEVVGGSESERLAKALEEIRKLS